MASIGGFAGYNEIARTGAPGSFLQGVQNYKSFFDKKAVDDAMKEKRGSLADAIMQGDYNTGASIAMNAGDLETALAFADLADKAESRKADIAYQNAQLGLTRDKVAREQDKINKDLREQANQYKYSNEARAELDELNEKAGRWHTAAGKLTSDILGTQASDDWREFEARVMQRYGPYRKLFTGSGQTSDADLAIYLRGIGLDRNASPETRKNIMDSMDAQIKASLPEEVRAIAESETNGLDEIWGQL